MNEKSYENILIYDISYRTSTGAKPLRIRFDKIDGFTRVYNRTRYLVLFDPKKYHGIYNRVIYLIRQKRGIGYVIPRNYARMKINYNLTLLI